MDLTCWLTPLGWHYEKEFVLSLNLKTCNLSQATGAGQFTFQLHNIPRKTDISKEAYYYFQAPDQKGMLCVGLGCDVMCCGAEYEEWLSGIQYLQATTNNFQAPPQDGWGCVVL